MEGLYRTSLSDHYSDLAHHYSRSGNAEKAVEYLGLAGQRAVQRSAAAEAVRLLTTALEFLQDLPDTAERVQKELTLQMALGPTLITTKGQAASAVETAYTRARELCQQEGDTPQLFLVLWGLWMYYGSRADNETAQELAEQLMQLAERLHDPALLPAAHFVLGWSFYCAGRLPPAREHYDQLIGLYDPDQHRGNVLRYGQDPSVIGLCMLAQTLQLLGYPDQAQRRFQEALSLAEEGTHRYSHAFAMGWNGMHAYHRGEVQLAREYAETAMAVSAEQGFQLQAESGAIVCGLAKVGQGQHEEGFSQLRQGLDGYRSVGAEISLTFFLASLIGAYEQVGQPEDGLPVVAETLERVEKTGERYCEAELYRLKGELTLQESKVESQRSLAEEEAAACFRKAIEIAQKQQAKSWELRATTSLARL